MNRREQSADELERALDAWEGIEPSASLLRSVARVPLEHPRAEAKERLSIWQQFRPFALSLVAGAVGVAVGLIQAPDASQLDSARGEVAPGEVPVALESDVDTEWEELAQLAAGEEWVEGWDE